MGESDIRIGSQKESGTLSNSHPDSKGVNSISSRFSFFTTSPCEKYNQFTSTATGIFDFEEVDNMADESSVYVE